MAIVFIFAFVLANHLRVLSSAEANNTNPTCPNSFPCQNLGNASFPFYNNHTSNLCGLCNLKCNETVPKLLLQQEGQLYDVKRLNQSAREILVHDPALQSLLDKKDCDYLTGLSFPNSHSISFTFENITLYKCQKKLDKIFSNYSEQKCTNFSLYYRFPIHYKTGIPDEFQNNCSVIYLPLSTFGRRSRKADELFKLLSAEFILHFHVSPQCSHCHSSGGQCVENNENYCINASGKNKHSGLKLGIVSGAAGATIVILLLIFYVCYRNRSTEQDSSLFSRNVSSYPKDVEAFLRRYGSSTPTRFRYSTIKKITNSFRDELGKGGYGSVYKGCLSDGRVVAVKVLNATEGNGEEFLNEVGSIGRTSHVNVVKLLGFCYEGRKRALLYDYMPNGSLEKFIYSELPSKEGQHLGWEKLYSIALGIARGLEYLHHGCNTRILHFDIKPHNILLDEDFRPKISDFGLAKLYNEKESIVSSIIQARGTIGYIAPEVFSRNFGQVSQKSDVYSYGMLIFQMIGGRKHAHVEADQASDVYYPHWLYKRIASDEDLCFGSEMSEEETEIAMKMVIVGLWCIQTNPTQRPYISKVIEMLEGQIASMEMPPKPYLCSAPSSPLNSRLEAVFSSTPIRDPNSASEAASR